ncbi:MAG: polysaccharide pyruvyl transferase family protein [Sphingobium sp.]
MRTRVLLISRLTTQNAGNEALSKLAIRYLQTRLKNAHLHAVDRYPRSFGSYSIDKLGPDHVAGFDALARRLSRRFVAKDAPWPAPADMNMVRLNLTAKELTGPLRRIKRAIDLRRRLAAVGLIEARSSRIAISACAQADLVIWNPAGEIHPTGSPNEVMRLLLMMRIAQLHGRRTAVINHSLEIEDPRLRDLVAHVYRALDYVGVRDSPSVDVARGLDVSADKIHEAPDLVFTTLDQGSARGPGAAIGMAVNGLEAAGAVDEWKDVVASFEKMGRPIIFVSNAVNHDIGFARTVAGGHGDVEIVDRQPGFEELKDIFSRCAVLVSSRLHSSILALAEGVPVVSIEPSVFKLTAIFEQMQYPLATQNMHVPGWADRVIANTDTCLAEGDDLARIGLDRMTEQNERIDKALRPLLALAGS